MAECPFIQVLLQDEGSHLPSQGLSDSPYRRAPRLKELSIAWESLPQNTKALFPLREWVRRNKDEKYVPTSLLRAFGFDVDG